MPTRLLISSPAAGKTEYCIEQIRSVLKSHPLAHVRVIVPDRLQASYFRRRLSQSGGAIGAYVGTFSDLYKNILECAGDYAPVASNALLHRIVKEAVDSADLVHYAPLRTMPGFLLVLRDSFAELKRALVYPEKFIEQSKTTSPAQQELAQLYSAYQTRLRQLGWADIEGLSWLAVAALEENPTLLDGSLQLLVVDGFDSFIHTQRRIFQLLADKTDLLITLPGSEGSQRSVHHRFTKTIATLKELSPEIVSSPGKSFLPKEFTQIERHLFETSGTVIEKPEKAFLYELRSPTDEAREALRWIKSHVIRDATPLYECAVFTPNPEIYFPLLRDAAREFGIPVHFTQNEALDSSPAISALTNLLSLPVLNFKTSMLFKMLRSPYFSLIPDPQTIDELEDISRAAQIVEGTPQWDEIWTRLEPEQTETQLDLDEERILRGLPRGENAKVLRSKLNQVFSRLTPPDGQATQTKWVNWLEDLLDELEFYEHADNEREQAACESFRDALRALVMSESIAGVRVVDYPQFVSDLQSTLEGSVIEESQLKGEPTLLIGRIDQARGLRYRVVALLGLSETIFPQVERPDPFLTEDLREVLGLDSRLERDQASLFYQAVTRSNSQLLITRPYLSDDGESWEPSPYWNAVKVLFDKSAVQKIRPDDPRPLAEAASSQELLFWAVRRKGLPKSYDDLIERWKSLQNSRDVILSRRSKKAVGIFEGSTPDLKESLSAKYAPDHVWSASRLETYGVCPHMFYISKALGLEASNPPELGLDMAQVGSILHKVLEETYKRADNPADLDSVLKRLQEVAQEVFASAPQKFGFRPSDLWEVEQEQFLLMLEQTITALAESSTGWTPFAYEQQYGIKQNPPLEIQIGAETIRMRGVIDRIDRNAEGELRVIDYKTGSSHHEKSDLQNGRSLQLPLYGLAARDALKLGQPVDGMYWQIKKAAPGGLRLSTYATDEAEGLEAGVETVKKHLLRSITGIRSGDFQPVPPKGGCPEFCPAVQWCWRYQGGRKND